VYGRMGHASSKCYCCDATSSRDRFGGGRYVGVKWTFERIQSEINDYILAHLPDDAPELAALSAEELSELIARSKINSALSGIKGDAILFRSIVSLLTYTSWYWKRVGEHDESFYLIETRKRYS